MVSGYEELVLMGQGGKPVNLFLNFCGAALVGQIACVNQNIAVRDCGLFRVGVGDADEAY